MSAGNQSQTTINSDLWTFARAVNHSTYFPMLVRGAAQMKGVPYSEDLLHFVAAFSPVVTALRVPLDGDIDSRIVELLLETPEDVDIAVLAGVDLYKTTLEQQDPEPVE